MVSSVSKVSHNSVAVKNTINVIAEYYMTERSRAALLTRAVKPDTSDVIAEHGFMLRLSFPFFT